MLFGRLKHWRDIHVDAAWTAFRTSAVCDAEEACLASAASHLVNSDRNLRPISDYWFYYDKQPVA